jgi:hypothetical protein
VESSLPDVQVEWEQRTIVATTLLAKSAICRLFHPGIFYGESSGWSPKKRAPIENHKTCSETDKAAQIQAYAKTRFARYCNRALGSVLPEDGEYMNEFVLGNFDVKSIVGDDPIGKIACIQEPGFKARFVANPNRVVQYALQPLGDWLFGIISKLPWDCAHQQDTALPVIQRVLDENRIAEATRNKASPISPSRKVFCYDLSNATDQLPLSTQTYLAWRLASHTLEGMQLALVESQLRLFELAARSEWWLPSIPDESGKVTYSKVLWTRGQPLGLYPSFPLFSLAHGCLIFEELLFIRTKTQRGYSVPDIWEEYKTGHGPFYIVGDDVVILEAELAQRYESRLSELQVPVNFDKSLASTQVGEFVGHLITAETIYKPTKWRQVNPASIKCFLEVWGVEAVPLLPKYLREVGEVICSLPQPVGLGFNPKGLSLTERLLGYEDLFLKEKAEYAMYTVQKDDGDASTIMAIFQRLVEVGVLLKIPLHSPDAIVTDGRADPQLLLAHIDPKLAVELKNFSKFYDLYSPKDWEAILLDILTRYPGTALGDVANILGLRVLYNDKATHDERNLLFNRIRDLMGKFNAHKAKKV